MSIERTTFQRARYGEVKVSRYGIYEYAYISKRRICYFDAELVH